MFDFIKLIQIRIRLFINQSQYLCSFINPFFDQAKLASLEDNCKAIGVEKIDYRIYFRHKRRLLLSQLNLRCSARYVTRKLLRFSWERPLPNVNMYMLTHTGCHYYTVLNVIAQHKEPAHFFLPVMLGLTGSWEEANFKRTAGLGHQVEIGSSDDPRFLLRMIKTCKKNVNAKIIIFIDLPRITSTTSIYSRCRLFNKTGSIINGHITLIKKLKINSCLLSHNTDFRESNTILCSEVFKHDDPNLFTKITAKMEEQILASPINWKFLDELEFFFHSYKENN